MLFRDFAIHRHDLVLANFSNKNYTLVDYLKVFQTMPHIRNSCVLYGSIKLCLGLAIAFFSITYLLENAAAQTAVTSVGNFQLKSGAYSLGSSLGSNQVIVNLNNNKSVLQWDRLNVPSGSSLQFNQPNTQSVVLNRVMSVDPSRIDGALSSNGQVWILNGSGVLFGPNSQVNVQGLLASSKDITDIDFITGNYRLNGAGIGKITNYGVIAAAEGGYVLLLGPQVENQGRIQAQLGQVVLASGKAFALDLNGDKLLRFDVTEALTANDSALSSVVNAGQLISDGGVVQMTARTANGLVGNVVNTGGLIQANSARTQGGLVVLDAGTSGQVTLSGNVNALGIGEGITGGSITALGDTIKINSDARINASGQAGGGNVLIGGTWQGSGALPQSTILTMASGAQISADALSAGNGGQIVLRTDVSNPNAMTSVDGVISAKGGSASGNGGSIETSGHMLRVANTLQVNTSAANGKAGLWLLDPVDVEIDLSTATSIQNSLSTGNVTVTTSGSGTATGDITVSSPITWTKNQLALEANGDININAAMNAGAVDALTYATLSLKAGYSTPGSLGGTYDSSKSVLVGLSSTGFKGSVSFKDYLGAVRTDSSSLAINGNSYSLIGAVSALQSVAPTGNYALNSDIDASATSTWNSGLGFQPIALGGAFTGNFNGLGHSISGLTVNRPLVSGVGLFSTVNGGMVSNTGLLAGSITGNDAVGSIAGQLNSTASTSYAYSLNNYSTSTVTGTLGTGGLIGTVAVSGSGNVYIKNNINKGVVSSTAYDAGGILGEAFISAFTNAVIINNYSTGAISGVRGVGGLIGVLSNSSGTNVNISNSFSTGSVSTGGNADSYAGGLIGYAYGGALSNSYATGTVTGSGLAYAGGLVGYNLSTISNAYATGSASGGAFNGSLAGYNDTSLGGSVSYVYGLNDASLIGGGTSASNSSTFSLSAFKTSSNFSNLSTSYWYQYDGSTAPLLLSYLTPITVTSTSPTSKAYDGTNSVSITESYSITKDATKTFNSPTYTLSGVNTGSQTVLTSGSFSSDQFGYKITSVSNFSPVTVTANQTIQQVSSLVSTGASALSTGAISGGAATTTSSTIPASTATVSASSSSASSVLTSSSGNSVLDTQSVANQSSVQVVSSVTGENNTTTSNAGATTSSVSITSVVQPVAVKTNAAIQPSNAGVSNSSTSTAGATVAPATSAGITSVAPVVTIVSLNTTSSATSTPLGAQTISPIETPKSPEDLRDPVLAALNNFKPTSSTTVSSKVNTTKAKDATVVMPLVQGVLAIETVPPRSATQAVDEQRLSASGNRSRW